ncbi:MAG: hypothetical protein ACLGH7_00960, partial [Actinomycetes bacterium]
MTPTPAPLPKAPHVNGRILDAQLHLMDRQVLDHDGVPVTTVDDLEVSGPALDVEIEPGTPAPVVTDLLTGSILGTRIFGGRPPSSRLVRIPWKDVAEVGVVLRLGVKGEPL